MYTRVSSKDTPTPAHRPLSTGRPDPASLDAEATAPSGSTVPSGQSSRGVSPPPPAAGLSAAELGWTALVRDSGADVAIVDSDGRVLYACPRNRWWSFALEGDAAVGRTLGELMGKEIGDERVELIRKACHEGVPYTILGMSRGVRTKTTVRPFQAGPESSLSRRHALLIGRAAQEGAAADTHDPAIDGPIVSARNLDLGPLATLTPRELDVLALIGKGLSTADIAAAMHRSVKTIEAHRLSLGMKLKARNRVELARIALRAGLTSRSLSFTHDAGPATVR